MYWVGMRCFRVHKKEVEKRIWVSDPFCGPITHSHNNNKSNWKPKRSENTFGTLRQILDEVSVKSDDANLCVCERGSFMTIPNSWTFKTFSHCPLRGPCTSRGKDWRTCPLEWMSWGCILIVSKHSLEYKWGKGERTSKVTFLLRKSQLLTILVRLILPLVSDMCIQSFMSNLYLLPLQRTRFIPCYICSQPCQWFILSILD